MPPASETTASRTAADSVSAAARNELVTGVLLVGGASRRFGSAKALATLEGETLAERAWRALAWCDERIAVGKSGDRLPLPFALVDDGTRVRAPLAGLVAGLRAAKHELCVFLPVDCPLVSGSLLERLAGVCRDAAVPHTGPLPGAYRRSTLPMLERRLNEGDLALRAALEELSTDVVACDLDELVNVNTEAELRALGPP